MRLLYIKEPACEVDQRIVRQLIRLTPDRKVTTVKSPAAALNVLLKAGDERPFDSVITSPMYDDVVVAELVRGILKGGTRVTLVPVVATPDQAQRAYQAGADAVLLLMAGTLVNPEEILHGLAKRFRRPNSKPPAPEAPAEEKTSPSGAYALGELLNFKKYFPEPREAEPLTVDVVRHISAELVDAAARLVPQLSPSARVPGPSELDQIIKDPGTVLIIAREGRTIVGMLTLHTFRSTTGIHAWIQDVVVDDIAKGRGANQLLMEEAVSISKSRGANTAQLTSRPSRVGSGRLYERLGFERRDTHLYRFRVTG